MKLTMDAGRECGVLTGKQSLLGLTKLQTRVLIQLGVPFMLRLVCTLLAV